MDNFVSDVPEIAVHVDFAGNPALFEDFDIAAVGFSWGRFDVEIGTVFVAVAEGELWANAYRVGLGMYAALPAPSVIRAYAKCRAMLVTAKRYDGIFALGGPLEDAGRLRYISGCTDTGLIQPFRLGDPCLNYLHFPADTLQTSHWHPSHRVGLVCGGAGICHTPCGPLSMLPGSIFVLPAKTDHWFETRDEAMRIVTFHPDSEFGPTDESHQMLNATLASA